MRTSGTYNTTYLTSIARVPSIALPSQAQCGILVGLSRGTTHLQLFYPTPYARFPDSLPSSDTTGMASMLKVGLAIRVVHGDQAGLGFSRGSYLCVLQCSTSFVN